MSRLQAGLFGVFVVAVMLGASLFVAKQAAQWRLPVLGTQIESSARELVHVKSVIDGDTIKLMDGRTVRYIGIDTPETKHPSRGIECFGQQASQRNTELVAGQLVELEKDVSEADRYNRQLRYVWVNGRMINEQLVAEGYAFARSFPPDVKHQELFNKAQQVAQAESKGLWSVCELNSSTK